MRRKLIIVLRFTYRGALEEYQQSFHFDGAEPGSEAGWKTIADEVWAALKPAHPLSTSLVRAYGYEDDSPVSNSTVDYVNEYGGAVPGTLPNDAAGVKAQGDTAIYVRFNTPKRSVKGKPVYLYSYIHNVWIPPTGGETPATAQKAATVTAYTKLVDGTLLNFGHRTTPDGVQATSPPIVGTYLTTHTLRHRGRRLPTS